MWGDSNLWPSVLSMNTNPSTKSARFHIRKSATNSPEKSSNKIECDHITSEKVSSFIDFVNSEELFVNDDNNYVVCTLVTGQGCQHFFYYRNHKIINQNIIACFFHRIKEWIRPRDFWICKGNLLFLFKKFV